MPFSLNPLRKTQSTGDIRIIINDPKIPEGILVKKGQPIPSTSKPDPPQHSHEIIQDRLNDITANDMELLLTLETQARMDALEEEPKRQRTLRFEIPPHPRSTELVNKRRWSAPDDWISALSATALKNHLSKWMHFQRRSSSEDHEDESCTIQVGSRVKLYKRPMPIIGVVKYKGPVCFDQGEWLGIELDSRVGNTDGSIQGNHYFQTSPNRGLFVKMEDAVLV
ncbi:hypothetical protein RMATCC62417_06152 [Rhizopus microsporus]|nr:hypothetical protein RMATCC62417_06152 [Rhizopus microsporus]